MVAKQRRYVAAFKGILGEMQQAGLMGDIPLAVAIFAFFGMVHYTPKWFHREGAVSPERLGELFKEMFLHGVLPRKAASPPQEQPEPWRPAGERDSCGLLKQAVE